VKETAMFDLTIEFDRPDGLAAFGEAPGQAGISIEGGGLFTDHDHQLILLTNDQLAAAAVTKAWDRPPSRR